MTTINDIHDLVELLQNHPEWAETLRNLILTKELLALPQTMAKALQDWAETNQACPAVNQFASNSCQSVLPVQRLLGLAPAGPTSVRPELWTSRFRMTE